MAWKHGCERRDWWTYEMSPIHGVELWKAVMMSFKEFYEEVAVRWESGKG